MGNNDSHEALADAGLPASIPAMPTVPRDELAPFRHTPYLLEYSGFRHSIGWKGDRKAGPTFVVARIGRLDSIKVTERFPFTDQGWADAWHVFSGRDASAAAAIAVKLAAREGRTRASAALAALDAESLCSLRRVTFNGGSGEAGLAKGTFYDVRFLGNRLIVSRPDLVDPIIEVPYTEVETVEVSGSAQGDDSASKAVPWMFALGLLGALLGLLIFGLVGLLLGAVVFGAIGAAVGANSAKIETTVRMRVKDAELYFLSTDKRVDAVRIEMSGPLRTIEDAHACQPGDADELAAHAPATVPDRIAKLASLLQQGLITREEFEHLKSKLIAEL